MQILTLHRPPFTVKGGSGWRKFADIGKRRLNTIIRSQMRGLTQIVRTVWIIVYNQLTQTSCHTRNTVRVGITMWLWAVGMGMHVALMVCQF